MQLLHAKSTFGWLVAFAMAILLSGCLNKPTPAEQQMRAQELDEFCADKTGGFIFSTHVEVGGQRLTCKQYVTLRAQGWSATDTPTDTPTETATETAAGTATDRPVETFTIEEIIRLKDAGVSDEVILQLIQFGEGYAPLQ